MPKENQSEIFIRLLSDALDADRLVRRAVTSPSLGPNGRRAGRLFQPRLDDAMHAFGPLDCVQLMSSGPAHPQNNS
jgi:hypothetical protein